MQSSKEQQRQIRKLSSVIDAQCKVTEENNGMGKTRALFKKIKDAKGTFHTKMGTIKDRINSVVMEWSQKYKYKCISIKISSTKMFQK